MKVTDLVRASVVVVVAVVLQHGVLDAVVVAGAHPDVTLALAAAGGYVAGPERGAAFGFATGLVADLLVPTTFGLTALVGSVVGYATGVATQGLVRSSWWLAPVALATATGAGLTGYATLGAMLGQPGMLRADLGPALALSTPAAAVLAGPVLRAVAWALPPAAPAYDGGRGR